MYSCIQFYLYSAKSQHEPTEGTLYGNVYLTIINHFVMTPQREKVTLFFNMLSY